MDMAIILLKGGNYFEHSEMAKCTRVILKNTGVYFGWDQASEDRGCAVLIPPLSDKMKETNNISHRAAIMGTVKWKSQERAKSKVKACFLLFPYVLFETLLTDADIAFL